MTHPPGPIVIIGGGHAAAQLCAGLAEARTSAGFGAAVHLVCAEPELPYQRPPLSKAFQKTLGDGAVQHFRDAAWYEQAGIALHLGDAAVSIDRAGKSVRLQSGAVLAYDQLVLATGASARRLAQLPAGLGNVAVLRSAADARALRAQLHAANAVTVLGGGFIGLELAATARGLGKAVTVYESAPRLLGRAVSPALSAHVLATHRAAGIDVQVGVTVSDFVHDGQCLTGLSVNSQAVAVELLVLGIGADAETALAEAAGLACRNGVVVDAYQRCTSDAAILAVGDCCSFPSPLTGGPLRLESVQNATDQARTAVATLLGREEPYRALPWFWSEQGALRLQMAGLLPADAVSHRRPGATPASFSLLHYRGEQLACVESVNAPVDHMGLKKLLEAGRSPAPAELADPAVALKSLL